MTPNEEIEKVSAFIEENTRASATAGIEYIDPLKFKGRILLKQNHVIFGRRGSGKSSLIKTLRENKKPNYYHAYTNLEDLKDISFPNIVIHVLRALTNDICDQLSADAKFYQFRRKLKVRGLKRLLRKAIADFQQQLPNPDAFEEQIKTKVTDSSSTSLGAKSEFLSVGNTTGEGREIEIAKKMNRDKLESLKNGIPDLKKAISEIESLAPGKPIFLIFDDFYFLRKDVQIFFIDFFHRLTKDTQLFLKVATIKHRSKIYAKVDGSFFGTEIGHDIMALDLDYTLNRFDKLKDFMRSLIDECASKCGVEFEVDDIFSPNGFSQLCLASGGVPRDFLTLFVKISSNYDSNSARRISKINITDAAIQNMAAKNSNLGVDSAEEKEILEAYLSYITEVIVKTQRTNMFLVPNAEIDDHPQAKQGLRELIDLRMLHLVEADTSASGGVRGTRYAAYMVDIGLYPSSSPRDFRQLDPGVTDNEGRKDEMRGAPKLDLEHLKNWIGAKGLKGSLEISEE